jgi:hypothetical protein
VLIRCILLPSARGLSLMLIRFLFLALFAVVKLSANSRRLRDYYALPRRHQILLDSLGWRKKIDLVDERIEANTRFLRTVINYPEIFEGDSDLGEKGETEDDDEDVSGGPGDVRKEDSDGSCGSRTFGPLSCNDLQ